MNRSSQIRDQLMPWAGLVAAVVASGVAHQFGSDGVFDNCAAVSPVPLIIVTLACIAVAVAGGFASWSVVRKDAETPARKVVAIVSVGTAALLVLAMLLPMIASLVLPPCFA